MTLTQKLKTFFLASLISGTAQAALQGRDLNGNPATFEAYYDTDVDITWLANANVNGLMTWADANSWAANLSIVDNVNNITYDDWRLPITVQPDLACSSQFGGDSFGYGCIGSEMGNIGNSLNELLLTGDWSQVQAFVNTIQEFGNAYWTATEYARDTSQAWGFDMYEGYQGWASKTSLNYAWAVSPGDVAAVPEAETYALMLAGLGLIGCRARRRD